MSDEEEEDKFQPVAPPGSNEQQPPNIHPALDFHQQLVDYANMEDESGDDYRYNPPQSEVQPDDMRVNGPKPRVETLDEKSLYKIFAQFFNIIDTFCTKQKTDEWKFKVVDHWKKRGINVGVMLAIENIDISELPRPKNEDQKFEF